METVTPSPSARRPEVVGRLLPLAMLVVVLLPVAARQASATSLHADGMLHQVGGTMSAHAPVEIAVSDGMKRVLTGLLCQCGCNLDVYQCKQTMTCDVSTAIWDEAADLVDRQGKSPEEAMAIFAVDFGEKVLASPTKRGFNLTVWILPFVGLVVGGIALAVALRRWRAAEADVSDVPTPGVDPRYLALIERELREES